MKHVVSSLECKVDSLESRVDSLDNKMDLIKEELKKDIKKTQDMIFVVSEEYIKTKDIEVSQRFKVLEKNTKLNSLEIEILKTKIEA